MPDAVSKDNVSGYRANQCIPRDRRRPTFVIWTSDWENSGGGVAEFVNPIYQALLGDLKASFS